ALARTRLACRPARAGSVTSATVGATCEQNGACAPTELTSQGAFTNATIALLTRGAFHTAISAVERIGLRVDASPVAVFLIGRASTGSARSAQRLRPPARSFDATHSRTAGNAATTAVFRIGPYIDTEFVA